MVKDRKPVGQPKRDATTANILAAAKALFIEKGVQNTTIQEIVKEAGSSIGNLYFNFANKDDLLQTLVAAELAAVYRTGDEAAQRAPAGPPRLATMIFSNAQQLLGPKATVAQLLKHAEANPVAIRFAESNRERVRRYIASNLPHLSDRDVDYASILWSAAGVALIQELSVREATNREQWAATEFHVRWNLRGLSVPEAEIAEAIRIAAAIVRPPGKTQGVK